mmetsp:Transcript_30856/g.82713  ORF Transcript_30856/g.82713 Transcript_30856/m.82713 type:complete len:342 (-) Transcript_30856:1482-2507(-)
MSHLDVILAGRNIATSQNGQGVIPTLLQQQHGLQKVDLHSETLGAAGTMGMPGQANQAPLDLNLIAQYHRHLLLKQQAAQIDEAIQLLRSQFHAIVANGQPQMQVMPSLSGAVQFPNASFMQPFPHLHQSNVFNMPQNLPTKSTIQVPADSAARKRPAEESSSSEPASKKPCDASGSVFLDSKAACSIYARRPRRDLNGGKPTRSQLTSRIALEHGVTAKTIRDIWNRRTWAKATRPLWTPAEAKLYHAKKQAAASSAAGTSSSPSSAAKRDSSEGGDRRADGESEEESEEEDGESRAEDEGSRAGGEDEDEEASASASATASEQNTPRSQQCPKGPCAAS